MCIYIQDLTSDEIIKSPAFSSIINIIITLYSIYLVNQGDWIILF